MSVVAFVLLDARGAELASWHPDQEMYAASTIKLAVAGAVLRAVDAGSLGLREQLDVHETFASRAAGTTFAMDAEERDPGMPPVGAAASAAWCLERMITVSSNEVTNLLVEHLGEGDAEAGLASVNEFCAQLGLDDAVRMTRLIGDVPGKRAGFTHATSARGLARLLWGLLFTDALGTESRALLRSLLASQQFPIIARALPAATRWGSKSGWDEGIRHDVAVFAEPSADERVLAICTEGFTPRGAQAVIESVTRALHGVTANAHLPL